MILVDVLIEWAKETSWGKSASYPCGWITSEQLQNLVYEIKKVEPFEYKPRTKGADDERP